MREKVAQQGRLVPVPISHEHADELGVIDEILRAHPEVLDWVLEDVSSNPGARRTGRPGLSADLVLRACLVKQMHGFSYSELAFHLADSTSFRRFCGIGAMDGAPRCSALKTNVKRISAATLERINRVVLSYAEGLGVEDGHTVRFDTTVEETNIHHPTDSSLLADVCRVLGRTMKRIRKQLGIKGVNRALAARRRALAINNAKKATERKRLYVELLKYAEETLVEAGHVADALDRFKSKTQEELVLALGFATELRHYIPLAARVIDQTQRRVLKGESVPADEKIVSIFEVHSDIIVKDNRDTYYGHKISFASGRSGLVLDCVVNEGNPSDSTLACDLVDRQADIYGQVPTEVAFDGGFASQENLETLKEKGVEEVAFAKRRGIAIGDMTSTPWVYRRLRRFRAGIEGTISFLKRCLGLTRCTWRSFRSFCAYTWASVVTANLLVLTRHRLESG